MKEGSLNKIIRDILRKTLEEDTASHAVYPAEQGRRIIELFNKIIIWQYNNTIIQEYNDIII